MHATESPWEHHKLVAQNSVLWPNAFADFYRLNHTASRAPFVIYFGGAISPETYESRRETQPLAILKEFQSAVAHLNCDAADLLVIPNPPVMRNAPDHRQRVFKFVLEEMLPLTGAAMPERMGLLGYSYGAYIAAMLSFELTQVSALATIGGVGMSDAADESERKLWTTKQFLCFANNDDMIGANSRAFSRSMDERGIKVDVTERQGGHRFDDYAENCSVRHAFAFLLESMRRTASGS